VTDRPRGLRQHRRPDRLAPRARLADPAPLAPDASVTLGRGHTVTVRGAELFVREAPAGIACLVPDPEPALLVHGLGGATTNWTDLAALLAPRLHVEAIDLPGFGRSGPPVGNDYSLTNQAAAVIDYLRESGRGPVHLVGNSMGGAISILVAARHPELVRTLTLISPAVPDVRLRAHPLRSDWRMGLLVVPRLGEVAMRRMRSVAIEDRARATIALCFGDPSRFPEWRMAEAVQEAEARDGQPWADAAMLGATRGLVHSQFIRGRAGWSALRAITAPTLVIWGDRDKLVAPDLAPLVAAAVPDARVLVLPDIGHTAMMEDPVTCARAMFALLDDVAVPTKPAQP
jgi:pimeloyl-ACP methyl ester carboxylesterase